jgi:hypothetical protein
MIDRTELRRLIIERRDVQAEIADARLRLLALEAREAEIAAAQRNLSAEIAKAEAGLPPEIMTTMQAG